MNIDRRAETPTSLPASLQAATAPAGAGSRSAVAPRQARANAPQLPILDPLAAMATGRTPQLD
ncbi:MAG TPA: hypothetical protein VNB49_18400 [Candidatus Dormibacteraeota bacterium]|nr:hypothetical protein [Candidatus Dormibacteraeota bacterium]